MDVFNCDGSRYIGSVVRVRRGGRTRDRGGGPVETGSSPHATQGNPELVHEEGHTVDPTRHLSEHTLGEEMGPVPSIALGNDGPLSQSARQQYATEPHGDLDDVLAFAVRPGRLNLGFLSPVRWVPAERVRSLSMDRIILDVESLSEV
jgi:hypothetical protein